MKHDSMKYLFKKLPEVNMFSTIPTCKCLQISGMAYGFGHGRERM